MRQVYLNNAATAYPRAPGVAEAVRTCLEQMPGAPGRTAGRADDHLTTCRHRLARLLAISDPTRIVTTQHATHALNLAIFGLGLRRGDSVVTTVTEHNSVLRPLAHLAEYHGVRLDVVGLHANGAIDEAAFDRCLDRRPRLVALNHASNVTGRVNPVQALFERSRQAGARTLVDASQSFGHVPVHPEALGADLLAMTGHKGPRGCPGVGALYVAPGIDLDQVLVGGTGVRSDRRLHPSDMPTRLEAGTPNMPALAGFAAALSWLEAHGPAFAARAHRAADAIRDGLRANAQVTLIDDAPGVERTPVVSFRLHAWSVEEAGFVLEESFGIACRTGLHCAPLVHEALGTAPEGTIRMSPSGATTDDDVAYALDAIQKVAS